MELFKEIILDNSKEGELVFDPFMGSGTTAIACIDTGRNFLGYELSEEYFLLAENRITTHCSTIIK